MLIEIKTDVANKYFSQQIETTQLMKKYIVKIT